MPGRMSGSGGGDGGDDDLVPLVAEVGAPTVYPLRHGLSGPIHRVSISWGRGNNLRVSVFQPHEAGGGDVEVGGKVLNVSLGRGDGATNDSQWRRIVYGSVTPYAVIQSRKNTLSSLSKMVISDSPHHIEWCQYLMAYSLEIKSLLRSPQSVPTPLIENPKSIAKVGETTNLGAAWELMEIFYADKFSQSWLPERFVDWFDDHNSLLSVSEPTIYARLVDFQKDLVNLQVVEDHKKYWEVMSSALAVGWLEIVVKMLRLHGSYLLDQLGNRETENGLVEAVAVLISKMPRMRPQLRDGKFGECFQAKPDFTKAWERWRAQITKLECSAFWVQCAHQQTRDELRNLLKIMMGNPNSLSTATCNWIELLVSHFLYARPFTVGLESMYNLVQKCIRIKPVAGTHKLMRLLIGILSDNTEVVLAECSREFGPWMVAHAMELLTMGSEEADILLHEEHKNLGGICIEELHRLVYAQVLSSHPLTWQMAPVYLMSCQRQGVGCLEILLYKQPLQHNQLLLKSLEFCRLYELSSVGSNIMKIYGVHNWKHGRKGSGVFWLQQSRDERCLNRIAQHLFDSVGKSLSDESFKQWEGLVDLLSSESKITGGLEFLHKYRDFKKSLQQVHDGKTTDAARQAVESLVALLRNPSTPQRFWLTLLYDSLKLLNWEERPLLDVSQTNLLLSKLQELSSAKLRPGFVESNLPPQAVSSVRLALATNLGRAILEEC